MKRIICMLLSAAYLLSAGMQRLPTRTVNEAGHQQPSHTYHAAGIPSSDPLMERQWALNNDGTFVVEEEQPDPACEAISGLMPASGGEFDPFWDFWLMGLGTGKSAAAGKTVTAKAGVDIGALKAWEKYDGGSRDVIVALIDTGVDITHEDLKDAIWSNPGEIPGNGVDDDGNGFIDDIHGWDFCSDSPRIYTSGEDIHGTHGAGTIAARANNGAGIAGIVQSGHVKLMIVKALCGQECIGSTDSIVSAIRYAEANGASICNLSLGCDESDPLLYRTMSASRMLFVVAAGNDGADLDCRPSYPAAYDLDNIVTVANLNCDGTLHASSSYGARAADLAAPGTAILSTMPGSSYGSMTGTSMAAPMVTAAAAMLYSYYPHATLADVKDILLASAKKLDTLNGKVLTGGMLDLGAAMSWDAGGLSGRAWTRPEHPASLPRFLPFSVI